MSKDDEIKDTYEFYIDLLKKQKDMEINRLQKENAKLKEVLLKYTDENTTLVEERNEDKKGTSKDSYFCHAVFPSIRSIPVPIDLYELKRIPQLIDKVPLYIEKIKELENHVDQLARKVVKAGDTTLLRYDELKDLMFRAFFIDLENRAYNESIIRDKSDPYYEPGYLYEMTRVRWGEIISNRNVPCEICGDNRSTDKCHIIPRSLGGTIDSDNILVLCPTHHRLFDRFMLSKAEFASIKWELKSKASQYYVEKVTLPRIKQFWKRVEGKNYSPVDYYEHDEGDGPIYKYTLEIIMDCFKYKDVLSRNSILKVLDVNIREIGKELIKRMLKKRILIKDSKGYYLTLVDRSFDYDKIIEKY